MTDANRKAALAEWIASRPQVVQELAAEFKPGDVYTDDKGTEWFLVGYDDGSVSGEVGVRVSLTDPMVDYNVAVKTAVKVLPAALRGQERREREI